MKIITLTLVIFFLISGSSYSQDKPEPIKNFSNLNSISDQSLQRASINYYFALNRENTGIVESAITNIMIMKLYFPEQNYEKFITKLTELSTDGKSKQIRYKSYIACNYLKHPERYNWIKKDTFQATSDFFNLFSEKLAKQLEKTENTSLVFSK